MTRESIGGERYDLKNRSTDSNGYNSGKSEVITLMQ